MMTALQGHEKIADHLELLTKDVALCSLMYSRHTQAKVGEYFDEIPVGC
jgi:hypothetical protein